ncbi:MAG: hypothetical protein AB8B78_11570, partial [Polaribacter sp.]
MKKIKLIVFISIQLIYSITIAQNILVETESFIDKGGWVVDPQFVEQMGSPYIMAHGMGIPVANAETKVKFNKKGKYHVWARTKNWVPGNWDAPGQFKIAINGKPLKIILGLTP